MSMDGWLLPRLSPVRSCSPSSVPAASRSANKKLFEAHRLSLRLTDLLGPVTRVKKKKKKTASLGDSYRSGPAGHLCLPRTREPALTNGIYNGFLVLSRTSGVVVEERSCPGAEARQPRGQRALFRSLERSSVREERFPLLQNFVRTYERSLPPLQLRVRSQARVLEKPLTNEIHRSQRAPGSTPARPL